MKRIAFIFFVISLVLSCSDKQEYEMASLKTEDSKRNSLEVSEPLTFQNVGDLNDYAWNVAPQSKALDNFVSYAETVMREDDYEDRPNAILSTRFGSVLNSEGEVIVAGYFLKLSDYGLLISDLGQKETVRALAAKSEVLSLCEGKTCLTALNPDISVSKLQGYDNIYFYDVFGYLNQDDVTDTEPLLDTRSPAANLVNYPRTLSTLGMIQSPYSNMTVPPSGSQKVLYDDTHCNDTKIWQQEYLVTIDRGIKVKTMKKSAGTWSKYQNPVECGIIGWMIKEYSQFNVISGSTGDINKVKYGDRGPDPTHYVYTVSARGMSPLAIGNINLQQLINEGNAVAANHNLNVTVEGVRFVVSDEWAYTRFPNDITSDNVKKIEKDWPTLFTGVATVSQSYILNSSQLKCRVTYSAETAIMYGQSTWGNTTKGSKMTYTYN